VSADRPGDEIRVLIADDEALVRTGFRMLVDSAPDLCVVGEANGASGFVLKDTPPEKLLEAIRVVAAGEALLAPRITRRLIAEFTRRPQALPPAEGLLAGLTEREHQVLEQVAAGLSTPR
jgi:DNA-binding NarL/FixJ family response regulator